MHLRHESLGIYIYAKPKNQREKLYNETMTEKAETVRCSRFESIVNERYDFFDRNKLRGSFLEYFQKKADKKNQKWQNVCKYFSKFVDGKCTFEEINVDLCNKFMEFLQEAKQLINNPVSTEALELIGFYDKEANRQPTDKVFPNLKDKMFQAPLKNWMKAAGITKHISFHCARHTFGSLQADAGTSIYAIQRMLGHKNVETTQIYANMSDETKRESVNRITLKAHDTLN